jgi:hypothetical protein
VIDTLFGALGGFNSIASPGDLNNDGKPELFSAVFDIGASFDPFAIMFSLPDHNPEYP